MYECVLFTYPRLVASARGVNGNRGTEKSTESVVRVLCKCAWSERVHYYVFIRDKDLHVDCE